MLIDLEKMPNSAQVFIYQMDKPLNEQQIAEITEQIKIFIQNWQAHGNPLRSAFEIKHNQFLILAVDKSYNEATGCSIDESVNFIKSMEKKYHVSFTDHAKIAFLKNNKVDIIPYKEIKNKIASHAIQPNTLVFDNMKNNLGEYKKNWILQSSDSWLKKYFN